MALNKKFISVVSGIVLAGSVGMTSAHEKGKTDTRQCFFPWVASLRVTTCERAFAVIRAARENGSKIEAIPTQNGENGEQYNQIDVDGLPGVFIYTPPNKKNMQSKKI